jgi:hypothetical protein
MMILEVKLSFGILKSLIGVQRSKRGGKMNIEYRLTNDDFRSEIVLRHSSIVDRRSAFKKGVKLNIEYRLTNDDLKFLKQNISVVN